MAAGRLLGFRILIALIINIALFVVCQQFWSTAKSNTAAESLEQAVQENMQLEQYLRQLQIQQDVQGGVLQEQLRMINELADEALKAKKNPVRNEATPVVKKDKTLSSFQVPEELHRTHDVAIPRDIPTWTDADTAHLETITGLDMMAQLLKEDYNTEDDLTDPRQINFDTIGRAERMYKSLWNHVFHIYQSLPADHARDREKALLDLAKSRTEIDFFLRLEHRLFPWLHSKQRIAFSLYESYSGRGYVLCAGNRQFEFVVASVQAIRSKLKSDLPIQIFYINQWDLSEDCREFLRKMTHNIEVIDISTVLNNDYMKLEGRSIKAFSILASKFEETILIDSDVFFLRDPQELFSDPGYQATGALFFYDRSVGDGAKIAPNFMKTVIPFMSNFPSTTRMFRRIADHEMESGVVVINKKERINGLLSVCKLNSKWERDLWTYRKFHSDKETFWLGFEMIQEPFAFVRSYGGVIGEPGENDNTSVCGVQIHLDYRGNPFWWNRGVMKSKNESITRDLVFGYWMSGGGAQENRARNVRVDDLKRKLLFDLDLASEEEVVQDSLKDPKWNFKKNCLSGWPVNSLDERELSLANSYVRMNKIAKGIEQKMAQNRPLDHPVYNWD
ncbi:hypothetical protein BGZ46_004578 [Entomortierella lignicola]|nr:hypothetical protein BGZ46_004578 [Entomortierella lignicola]